MRPARGGGRAVSRWNLPFSPVAQQLSLNGGFSQGNHHHGRGCPAPSPTHPTLSTFVHPESLNSLQRFLQARRVLRHTTRASNPAWYLAATELACQLHLRVDGESLLGWTYQRKTNSWTPLGQLAPQILSDREERQKFIETTLETQREAGGNCLGVVLHVADEFAVTEINPDLMEPGELAQLREEIVHDPATVLDDSTLTEQAISCRLFPLTASQAAGSFAASVSLSTKHRELLAAFRLAGEELNFPVRTAALSAPLLGLCALPFLIAEPIQKPLIAVFHYPLFTSVAFFSRLGELAALRNLPHHGQRRSGNLRHATTAAAALLELAEPNVCVVPMASFSADGVVADLKQAFPASSVVQLPWRESPAITQRSLPFLESLATTSVLDDAQTPLAQTETFTTLFGEGWALQDFLPPSQEETTLYPSRKSMLLARASRPFQALCVLGIIALAAWVCFDLVAAVRQPEWSFDAEEATQLDNKKAALIQESAQLSQWDNLLDDRSKAWANLELLSRMFPADSGVMLRAVDHTAGTETGQGKSNLGIVKNWTVTGFARAESQARLAELNTREGIAKVFNEVATATGNSAFLPDLPSRSLVVSISTVENKRYKSGPSGFNPADETTYPLSFTLNLSQRFEANDPLALSVSAPKKKTRTKKKP